MSSSPRVRLEVAVLDAEQTAPASLRQEAPDDERVRRTVLVVAGEADFRGYVRECLREHTDLRVVEAATVPIAVATAAKFSPVLVIADEPERHVITTLSSIYAIVIVDDVPRGASSDSRIRLLARPFTAERLLAEVRRLIQ